MYYTYIRYAKLEWRDVIIIKFLYFSPTEAGIEFAYKLLPSLFNEDEGLILDETDKGDVSSEVYRKDVDLTFKLNRLTAQDFANSSIILLKEITDHAEFLEFSGELFCFVNKQKDMNWYIKEFSIMRLYYENIFQC